MPKQKIFSQLLSSFEQDYFLRLFTNGVIIRHISITINQFVFGSCTAVLPMSEELYLNLTSLGRLCHKGRS
jgi:hypothetical protein